MITVVWPAIGLPRRPPNPVSVKSPVPPLKSRRKAGVRVVDIYRWRHVDRLHGVVTPRCGGRSERENSQKLPGGHPYGSVAITIAVSIRCWCNWRLYHSTPHQQHRHRYDNEQNRLDVFHFSAFLLLSSPYGSSGFLTIRKLPSMLAGKIEVVKQKNFK